MAVYCHAHKPFETALSLCPWRAALYILLSRDDGDELEALSEYLEVNRDILEAETCANLK